MTVLTPETSEVAYLIERDWRLGHLITHVGELCYECSGTAFSHLAHSVIEQMLSMKAGRTIEARLREACGGEITQDAVLALSIDEIRATGVAARKARTLHELAASMTEDDLESLRELDDEGVRDAVTSIRGIGKWTADMFLVFYLDRPDVLLVEDGAIRQVFRWLYGAPLENPEVATAVCAIWHPHCSIAMRYMYRALNSGIVSQGDAREVLGF